MSNTLWDPLAVCEMGLDPRGETKTCRGRTEKGASCKNRVNWRDIKKGHQKLINLASLPLDLMGLELVLCNIAKDFLCARWHRSRQADDIAHRWCQAAVRNTPQAVPDLDHSPQPSAVGTPTRLRSSDTGLLNSNNTHRPPLLNEASLNSPVYPPSATDPSPSMGSFVTAATLRADNIPWPISPDQPAFLSCVTNIRAGVQGIELHSLGRSDEVSDIHCTFCLTEDGESASESVVLRCVECRALSHLACIEGWLDQRDTGFNTSCCVCRSEGALEALIRPRRGVSTGTGACANDTTADVPQTTRNTQPSHLAPTEERSRSAAGRQGSTAANNSRRSARLGALRRQSPDPHQHGFLRRSARLSNLGSGQ
ncbi:hypothetical protein N7478_010232 [Penicillium angulare]|uniref:uncharacterized protein n=1 Tax=Penicillium angulare TaxID=116970 RepID=UPI0025403EA0|nr:uncharacterized protein N7478_010232 [Penicillium angulare]KAJ5267424.1 hypothetical protein N7478_010232 [Penicillium angulare]